MRTRPPPGLAICAERVVWCRDGRRVPLALHELLGQLQGEPDPGHYRLESGQASQGRLRPAARQEAGTLYTMHSALYTQHFTLNTLHQTFYTKH